MTGLAIAGSIITPVLYSAYKGDSPAYSVSELLQQTAVALEETGRQSPFEEKDGFTTELFETARRSTYALEIYGDKASTLSTGFMVETKNNTCYIATARHSVDLAGEEIYSAYFWRPQIDAYRFATDNVHVATSNEHDLAVLSFSKEDYYPYQPTEVIPWQDNVLLEKGEKVLIVGFPVDFKVKSSDYQYFTMGSVLAVAEDADQKTGTWYAEGLVNGGNSGSPVILNKDGKATVVGIVFGRNDMNGQHRAIGTELDIASLISEVKNRNSQSSHPLS